MLTNLKIDGAPDQWSKYVDLEWIFISVSLYFTLLVPMSEGEIIFGMLFVDRDVWLLYGA